jgi:hypothetical protein
MLVGGRTRVMTSWTRKLKMRGLMSRFHCGQPSLAQQAGRLASSKCPLGSGDRRSGRNRETTPSEKSLYEEDWVLGFGRLLEEVAVVRAVYTSRRLCLEDVKEVGCL